MSGFIKSVTSTQKTTVRILFLLYQQSLWFHEDDFSHLQFSSSFQTKEEKYTVYHPFLL